jgi:hypothetical protein
MTCRLCEPHGVFDLPTSPKILMPFVEIPPRPALTDQGHRL